MIADLILWAFILYYLALSSVISLVGFKILCIIRLDRECDIDLDPRHDRNNEISFYFIACEDVDLIYWDIALSELFDLQAFDFNTERSRDGIIGGRVTIG